jgi:mono/diheme cytochrome c family protein
MPDIGQSRPMKVRIFVALMAAPCGALFLFAQQRPAGPYTQAQAATGRALYQTNCASCHATDLTGREGPQLAGANFLTQWGDRTAGDLISYMRVTMPPGGAALPRSRAIRT